MCMREIAIQLAEPFGDDDSDLPVDVYVHNLMDFLVAFVEEEWKPVVEEVGQTFSKGHHWAVPRSRTISQGLLERGKAIDVKQKQEARSALKQSGKAVLAQHNSLPVAQAYGYGASAQLQVVPEEDDSYNFVDPSFQNDYMSDSYQGAEATTGLG